MNKTRITITMPPYNPRRYGRPWIARVVDWPVGRRPRLIWGGYIGDARGGVVEILAAPGNILRWGQKDHRGKNTTALWGIVRDDGAVHEVSEVEAREAYRG